MATTDAELSGLAQNLWKRYGFRANPLDTHPLSSHMNAFLPIAEAIVGRGFETRESKLLTNILRSPGGARVMVEGDVGVGKTTFINYHRYLWEHCAQDKLFTTQNEIAVTEDWRLRHFLANLLSAIIHKLMSDRGEQEINTVAVFKEVLALSRVLFHSSFNVEGSILGCGGGFGKSRQVTIPDLPETQLLQYFYEMVQAIKKIGYVGLFLHIDNLELFHGQDIRKARLFFEEIRDAIQIPDVYFVFVGKTGFFQEVISPLERVRSVFFGRPVAIAPLSKEQVLDAVQRRYQLLSIKKGTFIPPVEDRFIEALYDLYAGRLRYIMDAVNMVLPEFGSEQPYTIPTRQARLCLSRLVKEHIVAHLTATEWKVFCFCTQLERFTNQILSRQFAMPGSNAARILRRLIELDFVYLEKKEGRHSFYRVSDYTRVIQEAESHREVRDNYSVSQDAKPIPPRFAPEIRLQQALQIIRNQKTIRHQEYARQLNVSLATATRDLKELTQQGKIRSVGQGKKKYYTSFEEK